MATTGMARIAAILGIGLLVSACAVAPPQWDPVSEGHLTETAPAPAAASIPEPVKRRAFLPPPVPTPPEETFTVVVNEVPVRELLFALARDAKVNVDVHPDIEGSVTLNAIDQTLYQILDRISRQLLLRYETSNETLVIMPDLPFLRTYKVDYVNVSRDSQGTISASTLVASSVGGGGGGSANNTSDTTIDNTSNNRFWETLEASLDEMVRPGLEARAVAAGQKRVISNREGGLVTVRATSTQHGLVREYLDRVMASVNRQVLIEATIVEVQLNDRFQAGIDWRIFTRQGGLLGAGITLGADLGSAFTAGASGAVTGLIFNASDAPDGSAKRDVQVSINLLNEFGDTQVLSSPKVMTLNNQPAVLKVVDNEVYFEIEVETNSNQTVTTTTVETDVRTVSVGLVMNVTPQISDADAVTLNVRPTITRVREFVDDPGVPIALAQAGITNAVDVANRVPVVQIRETESVMRVGSGQLAILGGLMQDRQVQDDEAVPGFADLPGVGEAFTFKDREQTKSELVVFLRPTVIRTPDVGADLAGFRTYLPENLQRGAPQKTPLFVPLASEGGPSK
jgi:general secretion pathway protein D